MYPQRAVLGSTIGGGLCLPFALLSAAPTALIFALAFACSFCGFLAGDAFDR